MTISDHDVKDHWYSEDAATFGDRLAGAREACGLSQQELAERMGVTPDSIVAWENDVRDPRANRLQMLSGILKVSLPWLLTGEGAGLGAPSAVSNAELQEALSELQSTQSRLAEVSKSLTALETRLRAALEG